MSRSKASDAPIPPGQPTHHCHQEITPGSFSSNPMFNAGTFIQRSLGKQRRVGHAAMHWCGAARHRETARPTHTPITPTYTHTYTCAKTDFLN